jgi:DNA-binding transcriptional regulator YhcF (GntR family)
MDSLFFRVEHDLLRSESFQSLGGSAIKVYLTIGLYADFGTGWAYPSIRTIAKQAGLSRQTVLDAIAHLTKAGILATSKSQGKSTAYKIIRQAPTERPPHGKKPKLVQNVSSGVPESLEVGPETVRISLEDGVPTGPESFEALAQFFGPPGREDRPKQEPRTKEDSPSIPIPGTPFRISTEGRLSVAVDLQGLLTNQGIPRRLAEKLAAQKDPEAVAKVLLNALYLQSQGKLQNGPGYIRAGIEDGYELLPQVATRVELRRKELEEQIRSVTTRREQIRRQATQAAEDAAIEAVVYSLEAEELQELMAQAISELPASLVRRNPTISNPFIRGKVYELASGEEM